MFVPFLIMLREGLEAALIVSLIASYLKRTQRGNWIGVMWIGVIPRGGAMSWLRHLYQRNHRRISSA
ncbi:Ferrous iron transport permease EfeU [Klebsiella pneumoniae]|nr:Ferrous iron transport permease EfeU [Klebsiella pneumoniae]